MQPSRGEREINVAVLLILLNRFFTAVAFVLEVDNRTFCHAPFPHFVGLNSTLFLPFLPRKTSSHFETSQRFRFLRDNIALLQNEGSFDFSRSRCRRHGSSRPGPGQSHQGMTQDVVANTPTLPAVASEELRRLAEGSHRVLDLMAQSTSAARNENLLVVMRPIFVAELLDQYRHEI